MDEHPQSAAMHRALSRRLATQRLTSAPLAAAADVVRLLGCVQAQERASAFYSLGLRTRTATVESVQAELDAGAIIRTHILRPTWHFVAPEDLRWMLALTSPKVEQGMGARHRQLELTPRTIDRGLDDLTELLCGRTFRTRRQLGPPMERRGIAVGAQLGHLLLLAELRGLICSGPTVGGQHSYALIDEWVATAAALEPDAAASRLVKRFFAGHGPASLPDLTRWCTLTQADARAALAILGDELEKIEVNGTALWFDPSLPARTTRKRRALLLPVFDEATLSYPQLRFPRIDGHPHSALKAVSDLFSGSIIVDRLNVGTYTRTVTAKAVTVRLRFASSATVDQQRQGRQSADAIGDFHSLPVQPTSRVG
ncbi:MAG: winged helix DNA-binding domain-containing protein [Actinomycetota bacterium]|nr:winged helix DNA-binding domain-containing protein [Actinomycetota bacterium]